MSHEQFPGWSLSEDVNAEDINVDDFSTAHEFGIGLQEDSMLQAAPENLSHLSSAQVIPSQANVFTIVESHLPLNLDSYYLSAAGAMPGYPLINYPSSDFVAANSEFDPRFITQQDASLSNPQGYTDLNFPHPSEGLESYEQWMGGQSIAEQPLSADYLHYSLEPPHTFPHYDETIYGEVPVDSQLEALTFPRLDLAQPFSSSSSFTTALDTTTLQLNWNHNLEANCSSQDIISLENAIETTRNPDSISKSQQSSTTVNLEYPLPKPFGPSRQISLPPRRRGGRKEELSAPELKAFRESKKRGCHGGFPCKPCREISDTVLLKFPCTQAQFLELIEYGSYHPGMEAYQVYKIEKISIKGFFQHVAVTAAMLCLGRFKSKIIIEKRSGLQCSTVVDWIGGQKALEFLQNGILQGRTSEIGRQMIEILWKLAHSKLSHLPIDIDKGYLSVAERKRLVMIESFCALQFSTAETLTNEELLHDGLSPEIVKVLENNVAEIFENTVRLFLWTSQRYYEIMLFRSLQDAANRRHSISTKKLSEIVGALLDMLHISSLEMCEANDYFPYMYDDYNGERARDYYDRKRRIRTALFIYFSIMLDRLPAGYDFWSSEGKRTGGSPLDFSKYHFTDLKSFDCYYQSEIARARMHVELLHGGEFGSKDIQERFDEQQHDPNLAEIGREVFLGTLNEILNGPRNSRAELEAIRERLSGYHQPLIESLERLFNSLEKNIYISIPGVSLAEHKRVFKLLALREREIRQRVEGVLSDHLGSGEPGMDSSEVDSLIQMALRLMGAVERIALLCKNLVCSIFTIASDPKYGGRS